MKRFNIHYLSVPDFSIDRKIYLAISWAQNIKMGLNKFSIEEKTRTFTILEQSYSVMYVSADLKVIRMTIYNLKKAVALVSLGTVPPRKTSSRSPKKSTTRTNKILMKELTSNPPITAVAFKGSNLNS